MLYHVNTNARRGLGSFPHDQNRQLSPGKLGRTSAARARTRCIVSNQEHHRAVSTLVPSPHAPAAEQPVEPRVTRQYIRYLFYKARPSWRALAPEERAAARAELLGILEPFTERLPVLRAYSTLGTRADADFLLWMVTERLEDFQDLQAAVLRSKMGAHLDTPYSYLAMTRRSQYVD